MIGFVVIIVLNLFYIQIIRHEYYKKQAYEEQVAKFVLPAKRGQIYARDSGSIVPLVLNQPVYIAYADPQQISDKNKLVSKIDGIAGGNVVEGYKDGLGSKKLRYVVLARQLTNTQAEMIKKADIPGVGLTASDQRVYPEGSLASQVLGYVDSEGDGLYGVEGYLNKRLKGVDGKLQAVTDVRRIPLTVSDDDVSIPAKDGDNLVLSIDRNIQSYAESALKKGLDNVHASKGSVVVMNPNNGQVLAMANYPSYDPSKYNKVTDYSVFQNGIVSDPYEVGSVMKTLTMGVGLNTGAVNAGTTFNNRGYVQVDDTKISNVEEDPVNANATMTDVLHYSLNTGVVFILQQMGGGKVNLAARNKLYDYYHNHYRFGEKTGIEQSGESAGTIIPPTDEQGNNVRYANMVFGQGMDLTMMQTAGAFSGAINGGTYYKPTVIAGTTKNGSDIQVEKPKVLKGGVLNQSTSATLRDLIVKGRQLGALGGKDKAGYVVGGKTGTSQIIDPKTGKYTNSNSIGSYLGFGGNQTPQYVIMVQVKDSKAAGYAGTTAAGPIFGDVSNWLLDYLKVAPN
ncbi:MAG: penicillin-binding protein 2 [Candidatus Saccharibacteria bacterium]|nr:penicillin-binding protein 2 [Candidatus Saccharibacteria bacterium]